MNYKETVIWLYNQLPFYQQEGKVAYKKDLNHVLSFFKKHGECYFSFKSIHIAGTNGKGSVSHMLSSILQEFGLKVGLFTSPHLLGFRERIKINGLKISKEFIVDFVQKHKTDFVNMRMSFFEMNVAMAFQYFALQRVDIAIIEVGLGGRLDATNVIKPELSIITNVSLDHQNLLGKSLSLITKEKAGIIKNKTPVLIGKQPSSIDIIEKTALALNAQLFYSRQYDYTSDLKGGYQIDNINTAVTAINILNHIGYNISQKIIFRGLMQVAKNTGLLGRWQIIKERPLVICDIAHNVDAFKFIFNELNGMKMNKHIILGFSKDKNTDDMIRLLPKDYSYYICGSLNPRILHPDKLIDRFQEHNLSYKLFAFSSDAYAYLSTIITQNELILITGSTFIVSDILKYLAKS